MYEMYVYINKVHIVKLTTKDNCSTNTLYSPLDYTVPHGEDLSGGGAHGHVVLPLLLTRHIRTYTDSINGDLLLKYPFC